MIVFEPIEPQKQDDSVSSHQLFPQDPPGCTQETEGAEGVLREPLADASRKA